MIYIDKYIVYDYIGEQVSKDSEMLDLSTSTKLQNTQEKTQEESSQNVLLSNSVVEEETFYDATNMILKKDDDSIEGM